MPAQVNIIFEGDPSAAIKATNMVYAAISELPGKVKSITATVGKDFGIVFSDINAAMSTGTEQTKEFSLAMINLRDAGAAFTIIARQMKVVIDDAVNSFVDFDKTIQQTAALTTDAGEIISSTLRKDLVETARAVAVEFNQDIGATAMTLRDLIAMGLSTEEAMQVLRAGAAGAVAGLGEIGDTSNLVATTMRAFGLSVDDTTQIAAIFTFIGQKTNLTMGEMSAAMQYAGSIAGQMGFTLEETAAILGLMSNAGLEASVAGSTLRQFMVRIQTPTSEARTLLNDLGIALTDSTGNFLSLSEILQNVDKATVNYTQAQRAEIIGTLFETRGQAAFNLTMAQGIGTLDELTAGAVELNDVRKAEAFLGNEVNEMLGSQAAAYQRAQKEMVITQQILGEKLIPTQTAWLNISSQVTRAFIDLPGPIGQVNASLFSLGQLALDSSGKFFFLITSVQTASKSISKSIPEIKKYITAMRGGGDETAATALKTKLLTRGLISMGLAYGGLLAFQAAVNAKTQEERILYSALTGVAWGLAAANMAVALSEQLKLPVVGIGLAVAAGAAFITYLVASRSAIASAQAQYGALVMAKPGRGRLFNVGEGVETEIISPESMMRRVVSEEVMNVMSRGNQVTNSDTFIFNIPPTQRISEREARRWAEVTMEAKRRKLRRI